MADNRCTHEKCGNCEWHDNFSWVCSNGDSDNVADFTDNEFVCEHWEQRNKEE